MKAVPPSAAHTKLRVALGAHRHTGTPHDETHAARDAGANARDHQEEGNTPRKRQTPISTVIGLQSASGNVTTDNPTPLHARGAGGTHFLQGCEGTRCIMPEVIKIIPEENLWERLGVRGRLILHTGLKSPHGKGHVCDVRRGYARIHFVSTDPEGARDAEANTCDHQEEGNAPWER